MNARWLDVGFRLVPYIIGGVNAVERLVAGIKGKDKQDAAIQFAGDAIAVAEGIVGRDLIGNAEVQKAVRDFITAYVTLQNLIASIVKAKASAAVKPEEKKTE